MIIYNIKFKLNIMVNMNIKEFVEKMILEDVSKRYDFNSCTEDELKSFIIKFLQENEENKISYLNKIIEETEEKLLLEGNFKKFFENNSIKSLLRKCL
jgi:hypothetical protein